MGTLESPRALDEKSTTLGLCKQHQYEKNGGNVKYTCIRQHLNKLDKRVSGLGLGHNVDALHGNGGRSLPKPPTQDAQR